MIEDIILFAALHIILYILIYKFYESIFNSYERKAQKKAEKRKMEFYSKTIVRNEDLYYSSSSN
jgi:hypothetical protein